ncbi:MAG: hypothetical protein AB1468_01525 [Candidatus Micrarchaeota archaeon]
MLDWKEIERKHRYDYLGKKKFEKQISEFPQQMGEWMEKHIGQTILIMSSITIALISAAVSITDFIRGPESEKPEPKRQQEAPLTPGTPQQKLPTPDTMKNCPLNEKEKCAPADTADSLKQKTKDTKGQGVKQNHKERKKYFPPPDIRKKLRAELPQERLFFKGPGFKSNGFNLARSNLARV